MPSKEIKGMTVSDIAAQDKLSKQKRNRLRFLNELINFSKIEKKLKKKYKYTENASGQPAYPPLLLFKIVFLQNLYNLSDYEIEEALHDRLSFMDFVGLSMEDAVPDHSTISRFRKRLCELNLDKVLFEEINRQLKQSGFILEKGVIVDATVIEAKSRPNKCIEPKNEEESSSKEETAKEGDVDINYSREEEASWLKKGNEVYYGYKAHVVSDAIDGFILAVNMTGANVHESGCLESLISELRDKGYNVPIVFADKGYSSKKNRDMLKSKDIEDFIMHKKVKGGKLSELQKKLNNLCKQVRYKIERSFGTLKSQYGLNRSRYMGLRKVLYEFLMKSICFNVTKAIRLCF
ncbi:transposase, IS4 family [Deferribacter desulfuricans SSM1]|uniref:Transposase, IS4 family n=1 Tax=Deferribacter desulfuricans (strain DSM 14783 / JCM 11476 / NBRC 101012 / SSM1) TaxID=639282 RepID=D3PC81_DEFDS|nr:IS5 family transposase [Deferribacter desulfuricans]BAI80204.1 transposase, IS4 family [Deferribacter desulfuricans SSM1]